MKAGKTFLFAMMLFIAGNNLFGQSAEEWKKLGNIELDSANYSKAIEHYQQAIKVDSNYYDAYFNLGGAYYYMSDFDKSIEYYNKAIAKNDTIADAFFALGSVYAEKQDYNSAIKIFKDGLTLKPNSPEELCYLGTLYEDKGNLIYATLYIRKAAQMGDTLAQQYLIDNDISWEDNYLKPDYEQIKLSIENEQSDLCYSKLWSKYQQGDSTMTADEKRHLYYGYIFNKNHSPYSPTPDMTQINNILNKEQPTDKEWEDLVFLLNNSLNIRPFDCRSLYYQSVAFNMLNKSNDANRNIQKIQCIIDALHSTGDGLSKETAIHVIAVPTEYDYLFMNNLTMQSQELINGGYDVLYLKENEEGLEELWFDVNCSLNYMRNLQNDKLPAN